MPNSGCTLAKTNILADQPNGGPNDRVETEQCHQKEAHVKVSKAFNK